MVSPNEEDFSLRAIAPPSRNILLSREISALAAAGRQTSWTLQDVGDSYPHRTSDISYLGLKRINLGSPLPFGIPRREDGAER